MELLGSEWLFWLLYAVVIGGSLWHPFYTNRKKLKDKLASTTFSISYLLFLTFILALCVHVGLASKRYSKARQENQQLNNDVRLERFTGVSLDEQAEVNQKRISYLEQECEDSIAANMLETSSQARNEFALDQLKDSWARIESDIQIQKRPGFISLLPLPIKDTDTSRQYYHKRYLIQTDQNDRLEVVFKVLERGKIIGNYQWSKSKNSDGPFNVVKLSKENQDMRFSMPSGSSTLELKIYDKRSSKSLERDESALLELIVNDKPLLLLAIESDYVWFRNNNAIAVQSDYPREKLHARLQYWHASSKSGRSLWLEMYLNNTISQSDDEGAVTEMPAPLDSQETANE